MGKMLILPRPVDAANDWVNPPLSGEQRPVPDFAARLALWRYRAAERRERFRDDMHAICELAVFTVLSDRDTEGA